MIEKKQLAKIVNDTYYETQKDFDNDLIEDWEQVFFNRLDDQLETDTEKVITHLFYAYDDTIAEVVENILFDLSQETLLQSFSFEPYDDMVIMVCIVAKK
jgi:hypothetical protein